MPALTDFEHHCARWFCSQRELSPVPPTISYQGLTHRVLDAGEFITFACGDVVERRFVATRHGHLVDGGPVTCIGCLANQDSVAAYMESLRKSCLELGIFTGDPHAEWVHTLHFNQSIPLVGEPTYKIVLKY